MTVQINLTVNNVSIYLNHFVAGFIDLTVSGMIASLKGTENIQELQLSLEGEKVTLNLNGSSIPVNEFVTKIIRSTLIGVVSVLHGVDQTVQNLQLEIRK